MKTLRFIAYLFYNYYSKGSTKDIPYFSTLCALVMLFILHFFQLIILFGWKDLLFSSHKGNRTEDFILMGLYLTPVFLLFWRLVSKSDLENLSYDEIQIKRGSIFLVLYIILSMLALVLLMKFKLGK